MKKIIIIQLILIINSICISQVTQEWVVILPINNIVNNPVFTYDKFGNSYICVLKNDSGFITMKYNTAGALVWKRNFIYPGTSNQYLSASALDKDGNLFVVGYYNAAAFDNNYLLVKYSPAGNLLWYSIFDSPAHLDERATALTVDNAGNPIISGVSLGNQISTVITVKYNSSGSFLWSKKYRENSDNSCSSQLVTDNLNNVFLLASYIDFEYGLINVDKYNSNGDSLWEKNVGYNTMQSSTSVTIKAGRQNRLIAVKNLNPFPGYYFRQGGVMEFDSLGNTLVNTNFSYNDKRFYISDFCINGSDNIFISGSIDSHPAVINLGTAGLPVWTRADSLIGSFSRIASDNNNGIYSFGTYQYSENHYHFKTKKYNSSGDSLWTKLYSYSSSSSEQTCGMGIDTAVNIYIFGKSSGSTGSRYVLIKYNQPVGIQPISSSMPKNFSLSQNYPNPFNPATKIKFDIPNSPFEGGKGDVKLIVYDITGKEISILVNQQLKPGTYEVEWDGSNYSSGIYFYKLQTADYTETKRMVLIK